MKLTSISKDFPSYQTCMEGHRQICVLQCTHVLGLGNTCFSHFTTTSYQGKNWLAHHPVPALPAWRSIGESYRTMSVWILVLEIGFVDQTGLELNYLSTV